MRLLAQLRQLAAADLVQDPAGLLVAEVVDARALQGAEQVKRAACKPRADPERLQGRDQRVPAEERHEPREPGCREDVVLAEEVAGDAQRCQVDDRLPEDAGEQRALRLDARNALEPAAQRPLDGLMAPAEPLCCRLEGDVVHPHADLDQCQERAAWRQLERPDGFCPLDVGPHLGDDLLRGALDDRAALDPDVRLGEEAWHLVAEAQGVSAGADGGDGAGAAVADAALDLEQIGEVRRAEEPQLAADRLRRGVEDLDLLEDAAAHEPQATHGHAVGAEARCLGIRQEERRGVVVDCCRLEQREGSSVEPELPPAHEAGVLVHEASDRARRHVAARVREHERPPLEDRDRVGA